MVSAMLLISCSKENVSVDEKIGVVTNITSCGGGLEPVFIIKLGDKDSIMTSTLPMEFQVPKLTIAFKTKKSTRALYCTTDKIYPPAFDVFSVRKVENETVSMNKNLPSPF
tara:strand:+ start:208026 stop:208358 length:333 start_codon:yes stop_codon:yes gene_type:complete